MAKNFKELFNPKEHKWSGLSLMTFASMLAITVLMVYCPFNGKESAFFRANFLVVFTFLAVFGILFGEIGDRIPIWNELV